MVTTKRETISMKPGLVHQQSLLRPVYKENIDWSQKRSVACRTAEEFAGEAKKVFDTADEGCCLALLDAASHLLKQKPDIEEILIITNVITAIGVRAQHLLSGGDPNAPAPGQKYITDEAKPFNPPKNNRSAKADLFSLSKEPFSKWERIAGVFSSKRKRLQLAILQLQLPLFFLNNLYTIKILLKKSDHEQRKTALAAGALTSLPFINSSVDFLQLCTQYEAGSVDTATCELPEEALRMLGVLMNIVWGGDDADQWRREIRKAWLAVHPDKNNNISPFDFVYTYHTTDAGSSDADARAKKIAASMNSASKRTSEFLVLCQDLSRSRRLFDEASLAITNKEECTSEAIRKSNAQLSARAWHERIAALKKPVAAGIGEKTFIPEQQ
jgi:hypothetical protein